MVSVGETESLKSNAWLWLWPSVSSPRKGWYHVDPGDYLARGNGRLGMRGKLEEYLESQGADPSGYPYAYLVTAARFLGYHFNPASFWYLYNKDKHLAAMIIEVNNTFGERRAYFLKPDDELHDLIEATSSVGILAGKQPRSIFRQSWAKDFHVSPFNSRTGSYSLAASDPLAPHMQGTGTISNTIHLTSSKGHGKIVARLKRHSDAVDPHTMSWITKYGFLMSWWWVGFATFPRIIKEAGVLFFRKQLHVWYRPEPLQDSLGRNADATERRLEVAFRQYLRYLVEKSNAALAVKYTPSGIADEGKELMLSPTARDATAVDELEFKVLTPVFYSRFVCYAHDVEAFYGEFRESCTIWLSRPELLPKIAIKRPSPPLQLSSISDYVIFKGIQYLRRRPERIERPLTSSKGSTATSTAKDIRDFRLSSMDGYVLACESAKTRISYRNSVLKLFVADRIALGSMALLEMLRLGLQAAFTWILWSAVQSILLDSEKYSSSTA